MARPNSVDLTPPKVNLTLYAGDGANLRLVATDPEGEPFDLRGTVRAQIRRTRLDTTPLAEWDVEMAEAQQGIVVLRLTGQDTRDLMADKLKFKGAWDVVWTINDGEPVTLIQGDVTADMDVTR